MLYSLKEEIKEVIVLSQVSRFRKLFLTKLNRSLNGEHLEKWQLKKLIIKYTALPLKLGSYAYLYAQLNNSAGTGLRLASITSLSLCIYGFYMYIYIHTHT